MDDETSETPYAFSFTGGQSPVSLTLSVQTDGGNEWLGMLELKHDDDDDDTWDTTDETFDYVYPSPNFKAVTLSTP